MFKSAAHAMFVFATITAIPGATQAQIGFGAQSPQGCADGSCASEQTASVVAVQQGRSALFGGNDSGHGIGARSGGLFSGSCDVDGCAAGCSAVAYSLNGVDLYSYDRQEPWLHGQYMRIPAYGGYNSFRPYNYRHILAQQEIAAARGGSRQLPYSQQFWNRQRAKYLNRHLSDVDSPDDSTSLPSTARSTTSTQQDSTPEADAPNAVPRTGSATAQMVSVQDTTGQSVPAQTTVAPNRQSPIVMVPQQTAMQQSMMQHPMMQQPMMQQPVMQQQMMQQPVMQQPAIQQPMMQQPMMQQPVMQQPIMQQPVMQQPMLQHSVMQQPMMPPTSTMNSGMLIMPQQSVAFPQGFMPQHAVQPQQRMMIPQPTAGRMTSPMMMISAPQQNIMHQAGFARSAESAQPLIQSDTTSAASESPQPIHIYGSAILMPESGLPQ